MRPYAELLEFNQPNPIKVHGFTRIRDSFAGLSNPLSRTCPEHNLLKDEFYDPERTMEFAGRWDYGENNARKLGEIVKVSTPDPIDQSAYPPKVREVPIIQKYLAQGHESMIEMGWATFFIECSRVVSHELVRHRLASYQQESQRFVKYEGIDNDEVGSCFFIPDGMDEVEVYPAIYHDDDEGDTPEKAAEMACDEMRAMYHACFALYRKLREKGASPQDARYVLPNAFRTRMIMSANIREWRHILRLRLDKSAQPEMVELMTQVHDQLMDVFPNALHGVKGSERGAR